MLDRPLRENAMRDDDRLLDLPEAQFGSGVIGVCDICGTRQAVIVLSKERFKLCVIDFLNKTWLKTDRKPGMPAPLYRSERVWFETEASTSGKAQGVVLSPTKVVRHPPGLVTPDTFGLTTTLLDAAIRFAREGFEVFLPDVLKTEGIGGMHHVALRSGAQLRGGVAVGSKRIANLLSLYADALAYLRGREMVDPSKSAVFGTSYGASLALALAARDTQLAAVVLAYPVPVRPADLARLVSAPLLFVAGLEDRAAAKARTQIVAAKPPAHLVASKPGGKDLFRFLDLPGVRHDFLSRDLSTYDMPQAELAWTEIIAFLKYELMPPPPRPPTPPVRATSDPLAPRAKEGPLPVASTPAPAVRPTTSS